MSLRTSRFSGKNPILPGNQKEKNGKGLPPFVNMGYSLLLVVFLTLTLVIFSLLALTEGKRDLEASRQLAEEKKAYYVACSRSEAIRQQVILKEQEAVEISALPVEISGDQASWQIPVGEKRILTAVCDRKSGKLIRHQVLPADKWKKENSVSLWMP